MIAPAGDLEFAQESLDQKSFHLSLQVSCNKNASLLRIELGTAKPDRAVALSPSCVALLVRDELAGFVIAKMLR
jgi:hypothetical protein